MTLEQAIAELAFKDEQLQALARQNEALDRTVEQLRQQDFRQLESWRKDGMLAKAETALETRQPQEIGCHTFSHVVFGHPGCTPAVAKAELELFVVQAEAIARLRRS